MQWFSFFSWWRWHGTIHYHGKSKMDWLAKMGCLPALASISINAFFRSFIVFLRSFPQHSFNTTEPVVLMGGVSHPRHPIYAKSFSPVLSSLDLLSCLSFSHTFTRCIRHQREPQLLLLDILQRPPHLYF